jgi:probable phosphoglycerate mutase
MKKIYFVRHGATENNVSNVFQDENTQLSELGLKQAEVLGERFKSIKVDLIISSSMKRALQTAGAISSVNGLQVEKTHLFQEVLRPTFVRNKNKDEPEVQDVMREIKKNFGDQSWKHSDEENFFDLLERAKKATALLMENPENNIVVVTHGMFLTFLMAYMMFGESLTVSEFKNVEKFFIAKNTGITMLELHGEKFELMTWSDHAHLGELDIKG